MKSFVADFFIPLLVPVPLPGKCFFSVDDLCFLLNLMNFAQIIPNGIQYLCCVVGVETLKSGSSLESTGNEDTN
jgi:hypothetical protein